MEQFLAYLEYLAERSNSDMDEGYTAFAKKEGQLMEYITLVEENSSVLWSIYP
jgi:hypothetical protein